MRAAGVAAAKVRRRHLPSLSPTSIIVSLDPVELGAFEVWVADLPDPKPSREEAAAAYRPDVGEEMSRTQSPLPSPPAAQGAGRYPACPRDAQWPLANSVAAFVRAFLGRSARTIVAAIAMSIASTVIRSLGPTWPVRALKLAYLE